MIHQYKMNGYNIVIDGNSGSIHAVDDLAYDLIGLFEAKTEDEIVAELGEKYRAFPDIAADEIRAVYHDVQTLKENGSLFSEDPYVNQAFDFKNRQAVVKALCLHIAHDCNLACKYCFAGKGEYQGARSLMSFEVGRQALDFLIAQSGTRKNLEVDFFGGEPLMNFDVVKQLVAYGRSQEAKKNISFHFTLTTNGILLDDEIMEFANREMNNVVLSIDGRREVNDRMRVSKTGTGCYDLILPKFMRFAKLRHQQKYYIRGTYTHYNTDFSNDILHLADLGFQQLSMEPVVAPPDAPYALTEEDVPKLCAEYERLAVEMRNRSRKGEGFTFFHYMLDLEGGPCIVKRISGCGVGTEYMAVTPWGDLYPCHQFVGNDRYLLGNVFEGVTNKPVQDEFQRCNVYAHEACKDCFAKFYCSGGCAANAFHASGSITGMYDIGCKLHRKRIECAVMLKVAEALDADSTL
ncbi:MAG: thioether cross-link-forming SCIFF peptide maturase [Oscillospiraceae bacterium]|nr:thioether cross-link-forming SCIFF peptide maturase [Oscillospiraceae bacterium]